MTARKCPTKKDDAERPMDERGLLSQLSPVSIGDNVIYLFTAIWERKPRCGGTKRNNVEQFYN